MSTSDSAIITEAAEKGHKGALSPMGHQLTLSGKSSDKNFHFAYLDEFWLNSINSNSELFNSNRFILKPITLP